jgi:hypothetical protein
VCKIWIRSVVLVLLLLQQREVCSGIDGHLENRSVSEDFILSQLFTANVGPVSL